MMWDNSMIVNWVLLFKSPMTGKQSDPMTAMTGIKKPKTLGVK